MAKPGTKRPGHDKAGIGVPVAGHSVPTTLRPALRALCERHRIAKIIIGRAAGGSHGMSDGLLKVQCRTPTGYKAAGYSSKGVCDVWLITGTQEDIPVPSQWTR